MQADEDWLEIPGEGRITAGRKLAKEKNRFKSMAVGAVTSGQGGERRVWCCDGRYVAYRPSKAHDATKQRHANFLAAGHYEHVATEDDVQIFKLKPASPFYRKEGLDIQGLGTWECMRQAAIAACKRDWPLYVDVIEEIATRCRTGRDPGFASSMFNDHMKQVFSQIQMRGGPTPQECTAGKDNVMRKRGGRRIIVPRSL